MVVPKLGPALIAISLLGACGGADGGDLSGGSEAGSPGSGGASQGGGVQPDGGDDALEAEGGGGSGTGTGGQNGAGEGSLGPRHVIPDGPVTVDGRVLKVGSEAIQIRGVCYNPVTLGGTHPANLDFSGSAAADIPLMQAAGINVVRTYEPIVDVAVLDALHEAGIKVIMTVYAWGGAEPSAALTPVKAVKSHPAILMWLVGNEWNYNGLYVGLSHSESLAKVKEAAELIRGEDPNHLIATAYGEVPSVETLEALSGIDVWGINSYRGLSFGDLFSVWAERSTRPLFLSEYGADAYDARGAGKENLAAQAEATLALAGELETHAARDGGASSGGTIFEWSDEWWKDAAGDPAVHDVGGVAPGGGPHPDATFNEEWWGIVTIERAPRPAYSALQSLFLTP